MCTLLVISYTGGGGGRREKLSCLEWEKKVARPSLMAGKRRRRKKPLFGMRSDVRETVNLYIARAMKSFPLFLHRSLRESINDPVAMCVCSLPLRGLNRQVSSKRGSQSNWGLGSLSLKTQQWTIREDLWIISFLFYILMREMKKKIIGLTNLERVPWTLTNKLE